VARIGLRWTLRPGQTVKEFVTDQTPILVVVLLGEGVFTGGDGKERRLGPNSLIAFDEGEPHSARAVSSLVFVAFLHDART
jgi:quercetin dioxygenase-like cupin family protein